MKHDQVLRIQSLTAKQAGRAGSKNKIRDVARHNLRELPPEPHIDASRSSQNRVLYGPENAEEVARKAKAMMAEAGIEPRENAVLGIEILICLPVAFSGDAMAFFADSLAWVDEFFQVPVLSAVVHFDESCPHMHVVLLPILDGRLQGSKVMGDRNHIQAMQTDFYSSVGSRYGLRRQATARRSKADRVSLAAKILDEIMADPAQLKGGQIKSLLLGAIAQNPELWAASLGMAMPEPAQKKRKQSFVSIMTKPQKPERKSPIGVRQTPNRVSGPKKANPYALLGVSISDREKEPAIDVPSVPHLAPATAADLHHELDDAHASSTPTPTNDSQQAAHITNTNTDVVTASEALPDDSPVLMDDGDFERVRDVELDPGEWDADRGEFIRQPARASSKAAAVNAVRLALATIGGRPPGRGWRIASP